MDVLIRCTDVSICVLCCKKHWRHRQMFQITLLCIHSYKSWPNLLRRNFPFGPILKKRCKITNLILKWVYIQLFHFFRGIGPKEKYPLKLRHLLVFETFQSFLFEVFRLRKFYDFRVICRQFADHLHFFPKIYQVLKLKVS